MFIKNDVFNFINDVVKQTTGLEDVSVANAEDLVSLGNRVLSSDNNVENFMNVLVDRIAKSIVSNRPYSAKVKSLMMDTFTFGAVLQKIYVDPMKARKSESWGIDDNNGAGKEYTPIFIVKPTVKQKLFSGIDTWEIDTSIPDIQIRSAFRNASEMAVMIDAIYTALENSKQMDLEAMANMVYGTAIALRIIYEKNPANVTRTNKARVLIDLRKEYNDFYGLTEGDAGYLATADDCNRTPEFYRFASKTISDVIAYLEQMSVTFNTEGYHRHTPKDKLRVTMVHDFVSAFNAYLQSDVWHNELTKLPNYTEVPYWQGSGEDWTDTRKIALQVKTDYTPTGVETAYEVEQNGIVCVLSDVEAMGMTIDSERLRSEYDNRHEVTALYAKADKGYFVDQSENLVVFVVADEIATPTVVS